MKFRVNIKVNIKVIIKVHSKVRMKIMSKFKSELTLSLSGGGLNRPPLLENVIYSKFYIGK